MNRILKQIGLLVTTLLFIGLSTQVIAEDAAATNAAQPAVMACDRSTSIMKSCIAYPGVPVSQAKYIKGACTAPGVWSLAGCPAANAIGKCLKKGKYMTKESHFYDAAQATIKEGSCLTQGSSWTALPEAAKSVAAPASTELGPTDPAPTETVATKPAH